MGDTAYLQAQAYEWGPRILGAIAILIVAWLVARAAKWAIVRLVDRIPALKRHYEAEPGQSLGTTLGEIAFWLILLVGILLALQPLELGGVLGPVQQLTTNALGFIPNVIGAALIFVVGLLIARIARRLVEAALRAAHVDKWIGKAKAVVTEDEPAPSALSGENAPGWSAPPPAGADNASISKSLGMLVFLLIMIPVTISALDALKIQAISEPATQMLRTILDSIPNVLGALILLAIGYFVGKLVKQAVEQILPTMGFDRSLAAMGVTPTRTSPSGAVGTIVMIAVMIFFAIKAAELLRSPLIATMLAAILELGSKVLVGAAIILAGFAIAKVVGDLVEGRSSEGQAATGGWSATILRWSIIALSVAMGLRFMGLANEIVIIAFTAVLGSAAVAAALAFGLGGRETAGRVLEQWRSRLPAPPTPPTPPAPPAPRAPRNRSGSDTVPPG